MVGPWNSISSDSNYPGYTNFNNALQANKVAVELFTRVDCFSVLASKYMNIIKKKKETSGLTEYLEMLMASNMSVEKFNEKEKKITNSHGFGKDIPI
jgi:hypothetical protein